MAHELQVKYANMVDKRLRKTLVTKDNLVFNTRYEGNPVSGSVKIPVRAEVSVKDYNKATGITADGGTTTYMTVVVDKDKAVNEVIDGYDAAALPDNIVADRLDSAGYGLGLTLDKDGVTALEGQGTELKDTDALTKETVYDKIVDARTELSNADVPTENRYIIVSPSTYALILKSPDFIKASDIGQELVAQGVLGKIAGFNVLESNNLSADTEFIAGHPDFATRVDAWSVPVKVVDLSGSGKYIGASAVQGRKVYTHKVTEPKAVVVKKFI